MLINRNRKLVRGAMEYSLVRDITPDSHRWCVKTRTVRFNEYLGDERPPVVRRLDFIMLDEKVTLPMQTYALLIPALCADVVGLIERCSTVTIKNTKNGTKPLRTVYITDGRESVSLSLWSIHARLFEAEHCMSLAQQRPVAILFCGVTSGWFGGVRGRLPVHVGLASKSLQLGHHQQKLLTLLPLGIPMKHLYLISFMGVDPDTPLESDGPAVEFVCFGPTAEELIGVPVLSLVESAGAGGGCTPQQITRLCGRIDAVLSMAAVPTEGEASGNKGSLDATAAEPAGVDGTPAETAHDSPVPSNVSSSEELEVAAQEIQGTPPPPETKTPASANEKRPVTEHAEPSVSSGTPASDNKRQRKTKAAKKLNMDELPATE
ncbi:hypothetical protein EJB05_32947, partial [Eragrostis curvula]